MQKIKNIYLEEYEKWLKNFWNFDFDWKASNWLLSKWIWIVFDSKKDLSKIKAIVIWEAPWKEETINLSPFFGQAWKNLRENLENENDFYITNSIKFRPIEKTDSGYKNRTPSKQETKFSSTYLKKELEYLNGLWVNNILLVWNKALETMIFIAEKHNWKTILNSEEISLKDLKNKKTSDIINSEIIFEIDSKKYICYLIFHTSPLNYNKKDKKESIKLWLKEFQEKIKS